MKDQNLPEEKKPLFTKKTWIRLIAFVLLVGIAVAAFTYGISKLFSTDEGYRTVESTATAANCSSEFIFTYQLGVSGLSPNAEWKAVTALYSEKAVEYYRLFHPVEEFEGVVNLASLNASPGKDLVLSPDLYSALEKAAADPGRNLYLGPVFAYYETLFACSHDEDAATWDPARNADLGREFERTLSFVSSDEHVRVVLKGSGKANLFVSAEYRAFAEEVGITRFLDFFWMKNAFLADLFARDMTEAGYVHGVISSRDGFIRNFDSSGEEYAYDYFDERSGALRALGKLTYRGTASFVALHSFALDEFEQNFVYRYSDGARVTRYVSSADALSRDRGAAVAFSASAPCADLLFQILPDYLNGTLSAFSSPAVGLVWSDSAALCTKPLSGFTFEEF